MTKEETAQILAVLASAFPTVTISKETAQIYHIGLQDVQFSDCWNAVGVLIKTHKWFPPVALIREKIDDQAGLIGPSLVEAWYEVISLVKSGGRSADLVFSHESINVAVQKIGWWNICMGSTESMRIQFSQAYKPVVQLKTAPKELKNVD